MPPPTAHQPDRISTHYNHNNYFDTLNSSTSIDRNCNVLPLIIDAQIKTIATM
jgi:hypothetical protein